VPLFRLVDDSSWEGGVPIFGPSEDAQRKMKLRMRPESSMESGMLAALQMDGLDLGLDHKDDEGSAKVSSATGAGSGGGGDSSSKSKDKADVDDPNGPNGTLVCRLRVRTAAAPNLKKILTSHPLPRVTAWMPPEVPPELKKVLAG